MKKTILIFILSVFSLVSCSDSLSSTYDGYNKEHKVELYSGGKLIKTWTSTGKVGHSNMGYYFKDKKCQCQIEISGDVIVSKK